jgi:hypothetical protein
MKWNSVTFMALAPLFWPASAAFALFDVEPNRRLFRRSTDRDCPAGRSKRTANAWGATGDRLSVMPGLGPGIHEFAAAAQGKSWMAGTSPAMTGKVSLRSQWRRKLL